MAFDVAPSISFCECQGRFVFLDLGRERYFALSADGNRAFGALIAGSELGREDERTLYGLVQQGLLVECANGAKPAGCRAPRSPTRSLVETSVRAGLIDMLWAVARLAGAKRAVKRKPLRTVLDHLARRKAKQGLCEPLEDELIEVAAAFRRSALVSTPLDQCLPRSIAAAHWLLDGNCRSELVIGVRLQPFAAHCWLQSGPVLVNETVEEARNFTPILVV
jgi:hypothetical protein